jgi:hypothetical protein
VRKSLRRIDVVFLKFMDQSFRVSPAVYAASAASLGCRINAAEAAYTGLMRELQDTTPASRFAHAGRKPGGSLERLPHLN